MNIKRLICKSPYFSYINLTEKCNLRCLHCFGSYGHKKEKELNLVQWKNIIDQLKKMKVFFINISGGEPTQNSDFKEIIKYLHQKKLHFILTTNGIFSEDIGNFIVKYKRYLIGIKISLDGHNIKTHEFIRKGLKSGIAFNTAISTINFLKEHQIPVTLASVLHKGNIKNIKKFAHFVKKINPVSWFVSPIVYTGRAEQNKNKFSCYECHDINFWQNIKKQNERKHINTRFIDMPIEKDKLLAYECAGAISLMEIHAEGTVSPCTLARTCIPKEYMKFENIKDRSLQEIWNGEVFKRFRSFMNIGCEGCKMITKCNKCPAQSFKYFGNGYSPTPFCINQGEKLGLIKLKFYKELLKKLKNEA